MHRIIPIVMAIFVVGIFIIQFGNQGLIADLRTEIQKDDLKRQITAVKEEVDSLKVDMVGLYDQARKDRNFQNDVEWARVMDHWRLTEDFVTSPPAVVAPDTFRRETAQWAAVLFDEILGTYEWASRHDGRYYDWDEVLGGSVFPLLNYMVDSLWDGYTQIGSVRGRIGWLRSYVLVNPRQDLRSEDKLDDLDWKVDMFINSPQPFAPGPDTQPVPAFSLTASIN